jgi:hypothetical protein
MIKVNKPNVIVPEKYTQHTAPLNVPLRVVGLSKNNEYTKIGDIVIVLANQSVERSLLLTNFATNYKLHQPGYELQLIVEKECSVEIIGE